MVRWSGVALGSHALCQGVPFVSMPTYRTWLRAHLMRYCPEGIFLGIWKLYCNLL